MVWQLLFGFCHLFDVGQDGKSYIGIRLFFNKTRFRILTDLLRRLQRTLAVC